PRSQYTVIHGKSRSGAMVISRFLFTLRHFCGPSSDSFPPNFVRAVEAKYRFLDARGQAEACSAGLYREGNRCNCISGGVSSTPEVAGGGTNWIAPRGSRFEVNCGKGAGAPRAFFPLAEG